MDTQKFVDNFATIAEAPGGVQRLREMVIDLALQGRLSDPYPTDDSVDSLIAVIDSDREKAFRSNGWRSAKSAGTIREEELPWPIPDRWAWVRLERLALPQAGFAFKSNQFNQSGRGMPLIRIRDIGNSTTECQFEGDYREEFIVQEGDYLVGMDGNFNIRKWQGPPALLNQRVTRLIFFGDRMQRPFVTWALQDRINALHGSRAYTTVQHLSGKQIAAAVIPVPPIAEQARIVAKVDELMDLCDDLEARQQRRRRATTRYRSSALHALAEAETADDLRHAWQRVNANWTAVTTNAENVRCLQATVLQLAVEGRLVSRLPQEGTADQTLSAVNDERARLVSEGAIARPKASVAVTADEKPFELPEHWRWVHVEDVVTHIVDCLHRTPPYAATGIPAIRTSDVEPGRVLLSKALLVDEATYREQTRRLIPQEGDVLYSREGGRFGVAAVVPSDTKLCLSQRMMQFRCAAAVSPDYFSWFLNSPLGFGQAAEDVGGSASPHVNIKSIRRFVMPLPPTGEQLRIVEAIGRMLGAIDHLALSLDRQEERASRLADAASALVTG